MGMRIVFILWEFPQVFPWEFPQVFPWEFHRFSHGNSTGFPMGIPQVFPWEFHRFPMGIPQVFPWEFHRFSHGNSHRFSHGKPVGMECDWELKFLSHDNPVIVPVRSNINTLFTKYKYLWLEMCN